MSPCADFLWPAAAPQQGGFDVKRVTSAGEFEGYASIFDRVDLGQDLVRKGAFSRSIKERGAGGIKLLWQHDPAEPIGVIEEVIEDDTGLYIRGRLLLDVKRAREAHALMQISALDGLSIGYHTILAEYDDSLNVRHLLDVDLWEISLVTFPMQTHARISSFKRADIQTVRQFEVFLRDAAGFTRGEAKRIASRGFVTQTNQRDVDGSDDKGERDETDWGGIMQGICHLQRTMTDSRQ